VCRELGIVVEARAILESVRLCGKERFKVKARYGKGRGNFPREGSLGHKRDKRVLIRGSGSR
jgi:hypothetical protein